MKLFVAFCAAVLIALCAHGAAIEAGNHALSAKCNHHGVGQWDGATLVAVTCNGRSYRR